MDTAEVKDLAPENEEEVARGLLLDKLQNSVVQKQMRRRRMTPVRCSSSLREAHQYLIDSSGRFRWMQKEKCPLNLLARSSKRWVIWIKRPD